MEPVAPGTEDDVLQLPPVSKKASEQDRLLKIKAFLPHGVYGNVFELTSQNGPEHWYCRICECPIMGRVFNHESGKRHTNNMTYASKSAPPRNKPEIDANSMNIAPGEPVPPGFEGEITKVAQIQERLDGFRSGSLLGLEYLLEIQDYDQEKEPSYLCLLCGKKGDPRTVIAHLVSYNHLQGYLQRHFPKTYKALAPYVTRQYKKHWQDTMNKIAEAIETKYGRLVPHPVEAEMFEGIKEDLSQMVHSGPHFSEKNGVTFEYLVNAEEMIKMGEAYVEEISGALEAPGTESAKKRDPSPPVVKKPKKPLRTGGGERRRSLSSVSTISSSDLGDFDDFSGSKGAKMVKRRRSRSPPNRNANNRRLPNRRSPPMRGGRGRGGQSGRDIPSRHPWQRSDYNQRNQRSSTNESTNNRDKEKYEKFEEFKRLSLAIESDMEKVLKHHMNNPEKHVQYNEEWKIFWNRRYKELNSEGKDASKYDFKPEWIIYWNAKMADLHKAELKSKIEALRKRLGLPITLMGDPNPVSFKIGLAKKGSDSSKDSPKPTTPMAAEPDQDHEVIIIDDNLDDPKSPTRNRRSPPRRVRAPRPRSPHKRSSSRNRSHSPWEIDVPTRGNSRKLSKEKRVSLERISSGERDLSPCLRRDRFGRDIYTREDYRARDFRSREKSWERDITYHRELRKDPTLECYKPPPIMRDVTRNPVDYNKQPIDDGEVNVVGVLRLLTALEEKLGSLGPKVIDILATALAMEKKEANSAETLLDNEINCVLFETVKEKLKGLLHAELVPFVQEKAIKIAIRKIASLIHLATTRKQESDGKLKTNPVKVPGVGTVDKAAIAKQIASALIAQGKTDVTQAELEQLINAVVGMAEASKNSTKPITTASFLQNLSQKTPEIVTIVEPMQVQEIAPTTSKIVPQVIEAPQTPKDAMDGLSDSDLQTLLQNFKDLSTEEQHGLITYLKKLEAKEPERVEKLRKFVNLGQSEEVKEAQPIEQIEASGRISPFSLKLQNEANAREPVEIKPQFEEFEDDPKSEDEQPQSVVVEEPQAKIRIESDDEEYSYEDVFKAASKNVEDNKLEKERQFVEDTIKRGDTPTKSSNHIGEINLSDAKALIANIMGSIASKNNPKKVENPPNQTRPQFGQVTSFLGNQITPQLQQRPQNYQTQNIPRGQLPAPQQMRPQQRPYQNPQFGGNFQQQQQHQQQQNYPQHNPNNFNLNPQRPNFIPPNNNNNSFNEPRFNNPRNNFNNNRGGGNSYNNRWSFE